MPELPEVETIKRQLGEVIKGKIIDGVEVLRKKSFEGKVGDVEGRKITGVLRKAKMLGIGISGGRVVAVHLKMTGQLVWRPKEGDGNPDDGIYEGKQVVGGHPSVDWVRELPNSHTRVVITFKDGSKLFFNDLRVFGWMKVMSEKQWIEMIDMLPPDVTERGFDVSYLREVLGRSGGAVKVVLMDSRKVGGVGNIYANDALNLARISPVRKAKSLSDEEVERLYKAVKEVISRGIKYGGATYSDYKDTRGEGGKYQEHFLVYGRLGQKCKSCGGIIKKVVFGGRGTFYCERCQNGSRE